MLKGLLRVSCCQSRDRSIGLPKKNNKETFWVPRSSGQCAKGPNLKALRWQQSENASPKQLGVMHSGRFLVGFHTAQDSLCEGHAKSTVTPSDSSFRATLGKQHTDAHPARMSAQPKQHGPQ